MPSQSLGFLQLLCPVTFHRCPAARRKRPAAVGERCGWSGAALVWCGVIPQPSERLVGSREGLQVMPCRCARCALRESLGIWPCLGLVPVMSRRIRSAMSGYMHSGTVHSLSGDCPRLQLYCSGRRGRICCRKCDREKRIRSIKRPKASREGERLSQKGALRARNGP